MCEKNVESEVEIVGDRWNTCQGCGKIDNDDVEERYSYGIYAGVYCTACARRKYNDQCGLGPDGQGDPTELDEFAAGGYDAIYGEG